MLEIVGLVVVIYFFVVGIMIFFTRCSYEDAKKKMASFFRESGYELSRDFNYRQSVNEIAKDILGKARYEELCNLDKHSNTLQFCDNHDGLPSVKITLNYTDNNEQKRLETVIESTTRQYLLNYGSSPDIKLLLEWSENEVLKLPMLIVMYSRNESESKMLDAYKQKSISKIASKYGEVLDDTDDLL